MTERHYHLIKIAAILPKIKHKSHNGRVTSSKAYTILKAF